MSSEHWPEHHPDERTLGDAELLMLGALPAVPLEVTVPVAVADRVAVRGGLRLVDAEGAPIAALASPQRELTGDGSAVLRGTPTRVAHIVSGAFRHLAIGVDDLAAPSDARRAVLLDRPLLAPEVATLAELGVTHDLLLLVRTVEPQVPADVLVRATLAAADQVMGARVLTVPFGPREDLQDDARLAAALVAALGAQPLDVLEPPLAWADVQAALETDDDDALAEAVDPATLAVLRHWRPRRCERGLTVFFTGLSGSGKSTVARVLADRFHETDRTLTVLDGDVARRILSSRLTFSREDRDLNIRRLGWVAAEIARHGGVAICAPIAPFTASRAEARALCEATGDFVLVWVSTPLEECERRDRKGLYAKARRGEIPDFTGISSPYEPPEDADVVVDTTDVTVGEAADVVWEHLLAGGWLGEG